MGTIGMEQYKRFKQQAMLTVLGDALCTEQQILSSNEHVPCINPFLVFFSAMLNFITKDIAQSGLDVGSTAPLRVCVFVPDVQHSYHHYYNPFLPNNWYISGAELEVDISPMSLVISEDDSLPKRRLKQLLFAQHDSLHLKIVNDIDFSKTIRELFGPNLIDIQMSKRKNNGNHKIRGYTFNLAEVRGYMERHNYHNDYDPTVCLEIPIHYELVPTSSCWEAF